MSDSLWKYLRCDKKRVKGWLQRVDAEIIGSILELQNRQGILGGCVEIGVHHGKSFIPMCMSLQGNELALCIDIFDDQSKNLDSSGKGNYSLFKKNLAKFHLDLLRIKEFRGSSEDVPDSFIAEQVGPVRFFSVDGGHWSSIVQNDLRLAEQSLATGGVIALDDYCRAEWPDVTAGYTLWQNRTTSDIIPFAVGSNKLYLCRRGWATGYRDAIKTPFLLNYFSKSYRSADIEIDCYRVEPFEQDEARLVDVFMLMLKMFRPDKFVALKSRVRSNPS